ncbi:KOX 29 protein, partial [Cladochytrium replicatum]
KKFECAECGKCFTRKQDFVRHQHTHVEGFKPYECGNCGMRFSRSDALSRHYRRKICRE